MTAQTSARPLAVVTGASGGIGLELARQAAADGHDVLLTARSEDRLAALAVELEGRHGVQARVVPLDLGTPGAVDRLVESLDGAPVDVLVNNAGYATYGPFVEIEAGRDLAMLHLNVVVLTELSKRILPGMVARGGGRVLNLSSTAAFQPGPLMAVYYASKAYVLSLSEALAEELRGTGVTVTALCPGPTRSGFQSRGGLEDSRLVQHGLADVESVARAGWAGAMAGKRIVIPGARNRLLAQTYRLSPRSVTTRVIRKMQEPVR